MSIGYRATAKIIVENTIYLKPNYGKHNIYGVLPYPPPSPLQCQARATVKFLRSLKLVLGTDPYERKSHEKSHPALYFDEPKGFVYT